jgi:hypothetical protein
MSEYVEEKTQDAINKEIHQALFGANGEKGLIQKMDNVDEILSAFRLFGKAVMWVALFLGSVGTAVAGLWETINFFKHK